MKGDNSIDESLANDFGQSGVFFNDFCNVQQTARLSHKRQRNFRPFDMMTGQLPSDNVQNAKATAAATYEQA